MPGKQSGSESSGSVFGTRFEFDGHKMIVVAEIADGFVLAVKADDEAPAPIYLVPRPQPVAPHRRSEPRVLESPPANEVQIWTHGACFEDGGPGGWAYVRQASDGVLSIASGREPQSTPDRIKLRAVLETLNSVPDRADPLIVYSDSARLIEIMTNGTLPETDLDLWEQVVRASAGLTCRWEHARTGEKVSADHDRWTKTVVEAATHQARPASGREPE
jgi:ribonuclease HI